jgi:hypothetical protein
MKKILLLLPLLWVVTLHATLWDVNSRQFPDFEIRGAAKGPSGFYLLAYTTRKTKVAQTIYNYYTPKLVHLDAALNPVWELPFEESLVMEMKSVQVAGDRVYVVGGFHPNGLDAGSIARMVCTDLNGHTLWDRQYAYPGHHSLEAFQLIASPGQDLLLLCTAYRSYSSMGYPLLMRLGEAGDLRWQKLVGANYYYAGLDQGRFTADGKVVLAGMVYPTVTQFKAESPTAWLVKLDFDKQGMVVWEKKPAVAAKSYGSHVLPLPDGNFVVVGKAEDSDNQSRNLLLLLSPAGEILRKDVWGDCDLSSLQEMVAVQGGYFAVGSCDAVNGHARIYKTSLTMLDAGLNRVDGLVIDGNVSSMVLPLEGGGVALVGRHEVVTVR